ncbi:MAG: hypothetical protein R3A80_08765 [Bdellovibrionota bacterium]
MIPNILKGFTKRLFSALCLFGVFVAALSTGAPESKELRISVVAYNTENLFDTEDDPKIKDETYLPLELKKNEAHKKACKSQNARYASRMWDCLFLDWNQSLLDVKMKNLSEQIMSAPGGRGPDVLILEEVENRKVVEELNKKFLSKAGYTVTHFDSKDERGIDQAILSRYPLIKYEYHYIAVEKKRRKSKKSKKNKKTTEVAKTKDLRGILHAHLNIGTETAPRVLHVLALHLPSQGAKFNERAVVLNELNKLALKVPANDVLIAGGDFNITSKEWDKEKVYKSYFENIWRPAHMDGCKDCKGTYYYPGNKEWSFFDLLLLRFDREKKARWHWDAKSVKTLSTNKSMYPVRFDPNKLKGASDHFPIYAELVVD